MDIKVKNGFDRERVRFKSVGKSKVQQQFRKDSDINNILKKYEKTGLLVDPNIIRAGKPIFGDFSNMPTYFEAVTKINEINEQFMRLNPEVRAEFLNEPGNMVEFLNNPENYEKAVKMGILHKDVLPKKVALSPTGESNDLKVVKTETEQPKV